MRVGFYQYRPLFGQPERNCRKVLERLRRTRADLVVLPELALTGYLFENRSELANLAEEPSRSLLVQSLVDLCRSRKLHLVVGVAEKARDRLFNSALLLGPRGIRRTYRKLHLFDREKRWFDPGDTPLDVDRVAGVRVGMMVCFDWVFPEVARTLALQGAELLAHPSNLVLDYCQRTMIGRSIENGVFTVTANRFGEDRRPRGSLRFTGRSQITGPRGELLFRAPARREVLQVVRIDPARARDKRITPRNHLLADRRPGFYD